MLAHIPHPKQMTRNEMRLTTRNIKTEYSQPFVLTLLTMNGRHTPGDRHRYMYILLFKTTAEI